MGSKLRKGSDTSISRSSADWDEPQYLPAQQSWLKEGGAHSLQWLMTFPTRLPLLQSKSP